MYIREALDQGFILFSSSPAATGFFFVKKKDGSLKPCIDYRGLNTITIKDRHPLPLMNTSLDSLAHATIFTRLDLRNAYNLIRIREGANGRLPSVSSAAIGSIWSSPFWDSRISIVASSGTSVKSCRHSPISHIQLNDPAHSSSHQTPSKLLKNSPRDSPQLLSKISSISDKPNNSTLFRPCFLNNLISTFPTDLAPKPESWCPLSSTFLHCSYHRARLHHSS